MLFLEVDSECVEKQTQVKFGEQFGECCKVVRKRPNLTGLAIDVRIPDSVREMCDYCFDWCESLRRLSGLVIPVFHLVELKMCASPTVFVCCVIVASAGASVS